MRWSMSDPVPTGVVAAPSPDQGKTATIIYILYLAGFINGITVIIGLVMAYVNLEGAPEWVQTHYRVQIRTFWVGLLIACRSGNCLCRNAATGWAVPSW